MIKEAVRVAENADAVYEEGIYIGYRYCEKAGKKVRFSFGYGLSYTEFLYSDLEVTDHIVNVKSGITYIPEKLVKGQFTMDNTVEEMKEYAGAGRSMTACACTRVRLAAHVSNRVKFRIHLVVGRI